jgi:DHA1 family quinolone resistance protein-like MFS transporter
MASWTYTTIFAKELGMTDTEIGSLVATYSVALLVSSSVFGRASDKYGRKLFLLGGLVLSTVAFFSQAFAVGYLSLLTTRVLVGFSLGVYTASLVAYVHEGKKDLAKFVSFGSLGWGIGTLAAGVIALNFTTRSVFLFSSFLSLLAVLVAFTLAFNKPVAADVPRFPSNLIRKNLSLYASVLIRHSGAHMIWTFWPLFLQSLGADLFWVGVIQLTNSLSQFAFMYTLSGRIKYVPSIILGLVLSGITFFLFTQATSFWHILPMQILLGTSWSLLYVGGLRYLMDRNVERATASGLFDSVLGLASVIGPLMATFVIAFGGYSATMFIASALAFASPILTRLWNQRG